MATNATAKVTSPERERLIAAAEQFCLQSLDRFHLAVPNLERARLVDESQCLVQLLSTDEKSPPCAVLVCASPYPLLVCVAPREGPERDAACKLVLKAIRKLKSERPDFIFSAMQGDENCVNYITSLWMNEAPHECKLALHMTMNNYVLTKMRLPKRSVQGSSRPLNGENVQKVVEAVMGFFAEVKIPDHPTITHEEATARAEAFMKDPNCLGWYNEKDELTAIGKVALFNGGGRLGHIYTFPQYRGQGYGSAVTAALVRHTQDSGRTRVYLFADVVNPASNAVYQGLGFEFVSRERCQALARS